MLRSAASFFAAIAGVIGFGFALQATGLQLISDCSVPVRGPLEAVTIGATVFSVIGGLAVWLDARAAYLLIAGLVAVLLFHDFAQGAAIKDVLNTSCSNLKIR